MSKRHSVAIVLFRSSTPIAVDLIVRSLPCKTIFSTNHTDGTTLYAVRLAEGKKHSAADIHRRGLDEECSGDLVRFDGFGMGVLKTFSDDDENCWRDKHFCAIFAGMNDAVHEGVTVLLGGGVNNNYTMIRRV